MSPLLLLPQPTMPPFLHLDPLFCDEDHFDSTQNQESSYSLNAHSFLHLSQPDHDNDEELTSLLHKEQQTASHQQDPTPNPTREQVVQWMLRVVAFYSFSPLTALLAVTYLDRFLHRCDKPWMFQLAAVASLSLAAKLDETDVPLLLDFQVEEPIYVFQPKNIQKMEILILSTLEWKMNLITPFSFLDYIARRLLFNERLCGEFLARCERLILSVIAGNQALKIGLGSLPCKMPPSAMLCTSTPFIARMKKNNKKLFKGRDVHSILCCGILIPSFSVNCYKN